MYLKIHRIQQKKKENRKYWSGNTKISDLYQQQKSSICDLSLIYKQEGLQMKKETRTIEQIIIMELLSK